MNRTGELTVALRHGPDDAIDHDQGAEVVRIMIGEHQSLAENRLTGAVREFRKQVRGRIAQQILKGL